MLCSTFITSDTGEVIRQIALDYCSSNHKGASFTEVQCLMQTFGCPGQAKCVFQWQLRDFNGKLWGWPQVLNLTGKKVCLRYENVNLKKWFLSQPQGGYSYVWEPHFQTGGGLFVRAPGQSSEQEVIKQPLSRCDDPFCGNGTSPRPRSIKSGREGGRCPAWRQTATCAPKEFNGRDRWWFIQTQTHERGAARGVVTHALAFMALWKWEP